MAGNPNLYVKATEECGYLRSFLGCIELEYSDQIFIYTSILRYDFQRIKGARTIKK